MRLTGPGRLTAARGGGRALDSDSGVLPLINVVFLLLIFFMIAGQLAEPAPFEVEPPASTAEGEAQPEELLLLLAADGRVAVGDRLLALAEVAPHLAALRGGEAGAGPVRLRADASVDAATVVGLIEDLRRAGVEKVTLMTAGRQ